MSQQGFVGLIYVSLSSPAIAKERVAARVLRGGHGIPDEKIESRWHRSLKNLAWFAAKSTAFWVFDNSDSHPTHPPPLIASGKFRTIDQMNYDAFPQMNAALASLSIRGKDAD